VKAALAARLRQETTMSLKWICQRFRMEVPGHRFINGSINREKRSKEQKVIM
jgi:hypothetical protein